MKEKKVQPSEFSTTASTQDVPGIICKRCSGTAVKVPDGKGGKIWRCMNCSNRFKIVELD